MRAGTVNVDMIYAKVYNYLLQSMSETALRRRKCSGRTEEWTGRLFRDKR